MARVFQQFGHLLKKMLEQLAVRTEDGRLIYQDMLCMSWVDVCDADAFSRQVVPTHGLASTIGGCRQPTMKNDGRKEDRYQGRHQAPLEDLAFSPTRLDFSDTVRAKYGSALSQIPAL